MGGCFSDVKGGKAAVGGGEVHNLRLQRGLSTNVATASSSGTVQNDAVDFFFRSKGLQPLYTRIELISMECAHCNGMNLECNPNCLYREYFPPDQADKWNAIHTIFNPEYIVTMLVTDDKEQRDAAIASLVYEAGVRTRDPVHGFLGMVTRLNQRVHDLEVSVAAKDTVIRDLVSRIQDIVFDEEVDAVPAPLLVDADDVPGLLPLFVDEAVDADAVADPVPLPVDVDAVAVPVPEPLPFDLNAEPENPPQPEDGWIDLTLSFQVYDVDTKYHNLPTKMLELKDQDFLGEASCVLSEIVTLRSRSITLKLRDRNGHSVGNLGSITVHAEETIDSRTAIEMRLRCSNLDNKDRFSKSDPFLRISRIVETGGSVLICKTEVVNNNLNPVWKPLCLSTQQYGSKENPLVIECFDFNSSGNHILIGKQQTSVGVLQKLYQEKAGANFVIPSSHHRDHEKILKGKLFVDGFVEKELYSFLDYISSGFELNFMVAVDFTASNGDPQKPDSLHYIDTSGRFNAYQQDGVLSDLQETKDALVRASDLPLSILIVGVGNADFKTMEILDGDDGQRLESSTGRIATRDNVQFVAMRDVHRGEISMVQGLLEELPGQFLTYVRSRDIKPLPNIINLSSH